MPVADKEQPSIAVLLATHNGMRYLGEQIESILSQDDVSVHLFISDDASEDETPNLLKNLNASHGNVTLLPPGRFGSAHLNFLRLLRSIDVSAHDAVALADQDDIWTERKLARHWRLLDECDAVSSNVTFFEHNGASGLINKAQPQTRSDYLLESAGPGSTFLLSRAAVRIVEQALDHPLSDHAGAHDWLIYAVVRAAGLRWHIDSEPSVMYRQHDANVLGANRGLAAWCRRTKILGSGQHRAQARNIAMIARDQATESARTQIDTFLKLTSKPVNRMRLAAMSRQLRRRGRDQVLFAVAVLIGLWGRR